MTKKYKVQIMYTNGLDSLFYKAPFYFPLPDFTKIKPAKTGRRIVKINKSYIDVVRMLKSGRRVVKIVNGSYINSSKPLDKFIFQIPHKKNCQSNKVMYTVRFKLANQT
jgi:hypothetical protein